MWIHHENDDLPTIGYVILVYRRKVLRVEKAVDLDELRVLETLLTGGPHQHGWRCWER